MSTPYPSHLPSKKRQLLHLKRLTLTCALLLGAIWAACSPPPGTPAPSTASPSPTFLNATALTPPPTDPTPTPTSAVDQPLEAWRGTLLRFWHPWVGASGETVKALVEEFNLSNEWRLVVTAVAYPGYDALAQAMEAAPATGDLPDVVVGYPYQVLTWHKGKTFVDLNPYLEDPYWGLPPQQRDIAALWEGEAWPQGERLGVPYLRFAQVFFYNQTWARQLGYPAPPRTPAQFQQQACAAAQANLLDEDPENNGTGGWLIAQEYAVALGWIYAFNGQVLHLDVPAPSEAKYPGSPYRFASAETQAAFTFLRTLFEKNCAWVVENPTPEAEFAIRRALFASARLSDLPLQHQIMSTMNGDAWAVLPFPTLEGKAVLPLYGPSLTLIASNPERQLAAWAFIRWLLEGKQHARMVAASASFPLSQSELTLLQDYSRRYPQWQAALALLPYTRNEPALASWGRVRWALQDAFTQLFRGYFTLQQLPLTLDYLDFTAAELHGATLPTNTPPTPSPRP